MRCRYVILAFVSIGALVLTPSTGACVPDTYNYSPTPTFTWDPVATIDGPGEGYRFYVQECLEEACVPLDAETPATCTASSEELVDEWAPAQDACDHNTSTFWHTEWPDGPTHPHTFVVQFDHPVSVCGLSYTPRTGSTNGNIDDYIVETAVCDQQYEVAVAGNQLYQLQQALFPEERFVCFVRLTAVSEQSGNTFASAAEVWPLTRGCAVWDVPQLIDEVECREQDGVLKCPGHLALQKHYSGMRKYIRLGIKAFNATSESPDFGWNIEGPFCSPEFCEGTTQADFRTCFEGG